MPYTVSGWKVVPNKKRHNSFKTKYLPEILNSTNSDHNNINNYDNLYGAVTQPYRYKGALQATTLGRP